MKYCFLLLCSLGLLLASCTKRGCGCEPPPYFDGISFVILDKDSNNIVKKYADAYKYNLWYMEGNKKQTVSIEISDSFPKYKYSFYTVDATILSADKNIQEFYLGNGEDVDTIILSATREYEAGYFIKDLKFNNKVPLRDTLDGPWPYLFIKDTL